VSGDVHHGELSAATVERARTAASGEREGSDRWVEVTSSGLTHHCGDSGLGPVCPVMLRLFGSHRYRPPVRPSPFLQALFPDHPLFDINRPATAMNPPTHRGTTSTGAPAPSLARTSARTTA